MKKKTPARPAAKKKAAPKKARSRKLAAKPAAKKPRRAAPAKAKPAVAKTAKPAALPVHLPLHAAPDRPGLHLPMKPAPAYAQMIQRGWAGKPPPHKLTK